MTTANNSGSAQKPLSESSATGRVDEFSTTQFGDKGKEKAKVGDLEEEERKTLLGQFCIDESVATVGRNLLRDDLLPEELSSAQLLQQNNRQKMQNLLKAREKKRIRWVQDLFPEMTEEEVMIGLIDCGDDEQLLADSMSVADSEFYTNIRSRIACSSGESTRESAPKPKAKAKAAKKPQKKSQGRNTSTKHSGMETSTQLDITKMSKVQRKAYGKFHENPNEYYYRFNAPGEASRLDEWKEHEKALFLKRLEERGSEGQWGEFSKVIPGRVGYQCSNFYRSLLKKKELVDPRYYLNEKGEPKLVKNRERHELNVQAKRTGKAPVLRDEQSSSQPAKKKARGTSGTVKRVGSSRRAKTESSDDDDDEAEYKARHTTRRLRFMNGELNEEDKAENENPLPGFLDGITLSEVVMPAMSPSGHVLSYSSWLQCLECNSTCPMTGAHIEQRDLVILTPQNIEEYRNRIIYPE
ncbi:hypothetical protein SARC_03674 [Sphaeroforma arctica JP610]|uniref:Myb-like domain-containing protein n=1 Tax=Sphaeroforma arctica JP610 TaxID=667725 RepID=A0A0L0G5C2_9EUKA|nr:hypothetical protein SARC_03674 [Sphaeroforma arctica JP610]KNC84109.1 hypothetical protein SARC_03674 [Sphaeroforma arctica JP610]|eukprot:XP_014158011.1 hypothetical protein SARC_03674 [Sphaeroforma arctica JP610]